MTADNAARKRDAPSYAVKIYTAGQSPELAADVTDRVVAATFDDDDAKADELTLTLDNFDLSVVDDARWKKGNFLQFTWGYAGRVAPTRTCVIQKITGPLGALSIKALSKSILMNKQVRSRLFENTTRADVVRSIAKEYGYSDDSIFIDDTEVTLPHVTQAKMTDAAFLKSLAAREGFQFYVDWEGLHWKRRKLGAQPTRQFVYYNDPEMGDVIGVSIDNDVATTPGNVNAKGRDPMAKKDIDVTASNADTKRDGVADELEVVDPRTKTTQTVAVAAGSTYNTNAHTAEEAKREADGKFIKSQHAVVQLVIDAIGDPGVSAKQIIEIVGIGQRLSGRYYVKSAKHSLTASSYTMSLTVRSDGAHGTQTGLEKSDAAQNKLDPSDPNALVPVEVVDPRTKQTVTVYRRAGASKP